MCYFYKVRILRNVGWIRKIKSSHKPNSENEVAIATSEGVKIAQIVNIR